MPWNTTPPPEQRLKFVTLANSGRFNVSGLCEQFGISRKCGHKWLVRFAEGGAKALVDGSRARARYALAAAQSESWDEALAQAPKLREMT
jgi:transposase-like protein